jgi:hypothetical protein
MAFPESRGQLDPLDWMQVVMEFKLEMRAR